MRILAGDLGGTKTLLQLADTEGDTLRVVAERRYASAEYSSFDQIVADFLQRNPEPIASACIGVAGPVDSKHQRDTAKITNLPWQLDSQELGQRFDIAHFSLINDFAAIAYGVDGLTTAELKPLQTAPRMARGVRLILGAGTGLGVALMVHDGEHYNVLATEGGHAGFAPSNHDELEVLAYLQQRTGHVSIEDVLSGPGLLNIYRALHHLGNGDKTTFETIVQSDDGAAAVSAAAADGEPIANHTLDVFTHIYGNVAGNLALTCLPVGGIYLAGGIAPKILTRLQSDVFIQAFHAKGKMSGLMQRFSIDVIMNPEIGLIGARLAAQRRLGP